jgi:MarR family transcriptional regulator, organic hydroperoxide resistance regulator
MSGRAKAGVAWTPSRDPNKASSFELDDRLLSRYFRTANLLASLNTRWLAELNITSQQWSVLGSLSRPRVDAGMTVNQLSDYLMVSRQNLTNVLDRLDKRGFTVRAPDPKDGRTKRVQLTPKGRRLIAKILPCLADFYTVALEGFSESERRTFMALLDRLRSNLDKSRGSDNRRFPNPGDNLEVWGT